MKGLLLGTPACFDGVTVIPVVWQHTHAEAWGGGLRLGGERCAAAVVVKAGGEARAFAIDGSERDLADLKAALPELEALLAAS